MHPPRWGEWWGPRSIGSSAYVAGVFLWLSASSHLLLTAGLVSQDAVHLCYDGHGELWKDLWAERSAGQQGQMETRKV